MKIYEKPMAIIEKIDVEDVTTASTSVDIGDAEYSALKQQAGADEVILFQW